MKVRISNRLYIEQPTSAVKAYCQKNLVLDNPDFYKAEKQGRWTGNIPRKIMLYEIHGVDYWLPFGCLQDLWRIHPYKSDYINEISPIEPIKYESSINLYPYQTKAVHKALYAKNGVLVMPCGSGKGLPIDAKICTPTGWKRNGDLQIGDAVIGSNGKATRVTGIFDRGKVDAYKITFSDEVETICDKDHLWTVQKQSQRAESKNWFVENTENIYRHYQDMKCRSQYLYIPVVEPVNYYCYSEKDLSMNPWLLGFLLGDGCFQQSMISMSTNEDDLREKVVDIIGKDYGSCEWLVHKSKYDYRFCGGYVFHDIKTLDLYCKHSYEKFIPAEYMYNSIEVRLAVLQGLFDADGHISNGTTFEYSTTSKLLADNVVEIIESLGGTAKVRIKKPTYTYKGEKQTGKTAYRIFFKLYKFKPFTSEKHTAAYKERTNYKEAYRIIKKIEPYEPIISRCITVDAEDQLYVTEHYVVTHNTQCGLEIIARIGGRALWLTHTQDLLNQSKSRAESVLGKEGYGTITAGKVNIGTHITFATVQTMAKLDLSQYKDTWDVIIVDEAQHCAGSPTRVTQFYKVVSSLSARHKYGLTATPKRADRLEAAMFAILGGKIHEVSREEVAHTTCPVKVSVIPTGWMPDYEAVLMYDGTIDYNKVIDAMIHDENRFNKVMDIINEIPHACPTMVLANRVEYLKDMCVNYEKTGVCLSGQGQSKKAKEERKRALEALNNGELDCIFCTYSLAAEGLDVPNLRYIVFATPEKNDVTVTQATGRVGRKAEGKEYGTVIDFVDLFGLYQGFYKERLKVYKKLNCDIME
jgi:superfamily II DNA or RNA helicase